MANAYRTWYAVTEQDWVSKLDSFLVNVCGWYRVFTYSDTTTNRSYAWMSEGESNDGRPARIVNVLATADDIRPDCYLLDTYNFTTGDPGPVFLGSNDNAEVRSMGSPGKCFCVGDKDRVFASFQTATSTFINTYFGFIQSFYNSLDDPYPYMVRGQTLSTHSWADNFNVWMIRTDNTEDTYKMYFASSMVKEGYPNPRNGQYSFFQPIIYYDSNINFYEVRGRPKGVYFCDQTRLGHGSFVKFDDNHYVVFVSSNEEDALAIGPVSDDGNIPQDVVNLGYPAYPSLYVDYTNRGFQLDSSISGTLSLWRFDVGHLSGYKYGSGSALPQPTTYTDESGVYTLDITNNVVSVESRLREAASFNGSTQYLFGNGSPTASGTLHDDWTLEIVFKPSDMPIGGNKFTLIEYGASGSGEDNNSLLGLNLISASTTITDQYNVDRGNVEVFWQHSSGVIVSVETDSDFVQQDRWNYLAVVKEYNGSTYDLTVWHCSFGDYREPSLKATYTGLSNSSGGLNSGWRVGVDFTTTNYYNGYIDDTCVTKRALLPNEIIENCRRVML